MNVCSTKCGRWLNGWEQGAWQARAIMKSSTGNGVRRREFACMPISDFKMLTLASEISIFARTAEINCYYLMTVFCGMQFKRAEVN